MLKKQNHKKIILSLIILLAFSSYYFFVNIDKKGQTLRLFEYYTDILPEKFGGNELSSRMRPYSCSTTETFLGTSSKCYTSQYYERRPNSDLTGNVRDLKSFTSYLRNDGWSVVNDIRYSSANRTQVFTPEDIKFNGNGLARLIASKNNRAVTCVLTIVYAPFISSATGQPYVGELYKAPDMRYDLTCSHPN